MGAFSIVEMLYSSSLLAIVGAGEQVLVRFICFSSDAIWQLFLYSIFFGVLLFLSDEVLIVLQQPSLSPRRLCLFNTTTGTALRELNFLTSILAVRLNKKRYSIDFCFFFASCTTTDWS